MLLARCDCDCVACTCVCIPYEHPAAVVMLWSGATKYRLGVYSLSNLIRKIQKHTFLFDPATTSFQWTKFWCGVYVVEYFGARSVECSFVRLSEGSLRGREGVRGGEMRPSELSLFTPSLLVHFSELCCSSLDEG